MPTIREFRSNLKLYLEKLRAGEVVEIGDLMLACLKDPVHDSHVVYTPDLGDAWKDGKFAELKAQLDARAKTERVHTRDEQCAEILNNGASVVYTDPPTKCDKCKKPTECRKLVEEGVDYKVCELCAKKAKLNWHKLEKL